MNKNQCDSPVLNSRGFTLIELVIVFIVIGMVVVPVYGYLFATIQGESGKARSTPQKMERVTAGLAEHVRIFGRFPCPAPLNVDPSDANYASENCSMPTHDSGRVRIGAVPVEQLREAMDCTGATTAPSHMTGAFRRALNTAKDVISLSSASGRIGATNCVTSHDMIDTNGYKILYAVSTAASPAAGSTFNYLDNNARQIQILNSAGNEITDKRQMFVLVSHGQNGHGAYDAEGGQVEICPGTGITSDQENCDNDRRFRDTPFSLNEGANEYDDRVLFSLVGVISEDNLWHWSAGGGGPGNNMFFNPNSRIILDQIRLSTDDIDDADSLVINRGDFRIEGGDLRIEETISATSSSLVGGGQLLSSGSIMASQLIRTQKDMKGKNMNARGKVSSKKVQAEAQIRSKKDIRVDESIEAKNVGATEEIDAGKDVKANVDIMVTGRVKATNNVYTKKYCYNPPMTPECSSP